MALWTKVLRVVECTIFFWVRGRISYELLTPRYVEYVGLYDLLMLGVSRAARDGI